MRYPVKKVVSAKNAAIIIKGISSIRALVGTATPLGATIAVSPKTSKILNILLPYSITHRDIPLLFDTGNDIDVAISGKDVPTAMTVSPITRCDTPRISAITTAPFISQSAPNTSITNPIAMNPT
jgi:hypothetical protein